MLFRYKYIIPGPNHEKKSLNVIGDLLQSFSNRQSKKREVSSAEIP